MSDFRDKFAAFSGKIVEGSAEMSRKMSQKLNIAGDKMKELFQGSTQADKYVEEATSEKIGWTPDWGKNLQICDIVNGDGMTGQDVVRAIKKRLVNKSPAVQLLALVLLETCVKNCEKMFSEVAAEKVLDEMVKMVEDPSTSTQNKEKALKMIEAWGEATEELRYLPIFEETYKSLKSRGIRFPGRDEESLAPIFTPPQTVATAPREAVAADIVDAVEEEPKEVFDVARNTTELLSTVLSSSPQKEVLEDDLTTTLVEQCRQCQGRVQRLVERSGDNENVMFEGLQVNDEIQRVLQKFDELSGLGKSTKPSSQQQQPFPALEEEEETKEEALVRTRGGKPRSHEDESLEELDEMIFGNGGSSTSKKTSRGGGDDLISF